MMGMSTAIDTPDSVAHCGGYGLAGKAKRSAAHREMRGASSFLPEEKTMHVEKIGGEFWVVDNKSLKKIAGPFQLRETARAKMHELGKRQGRYLF
jgi:hypothetical protein